MALSFNLKDVPELKAASALRAEMANGSRILALPGSETTVRGYSAADLIVIDEAARVGDSLLQAVRPMLATSQGRLVARDPCRQARLVLRSMDRRQPVASREGAGLDASAHLTGILG